MYAIEKIIHYFFPLIALMMLVYGIRNNAIYYVISSLWLSLISLVIHFQASGAELLGDYFNYLNASIYSINLLILSFSLIRIISHLSKDNKILHYFHSFIQAFMVIASVIVIINLALNAYFIENKMPGTPIIQVTLAEKNNYCSYRHIFYKVNKEGSVSYLCPHYYGFIARIGRLANSPGFVTNQLTPLTQKQLTNLPEVLYSSPAFSNPSGRSS